MVDTAAMRSEYPGTVYHVLSGRDRRESIFLNDGDCYERVRMIERSNANIWFDPFDDGATFMEFLTEDDRAHGFPCSQLMGYTLERVPESEHQSDAPEDRLHLFFATHDVTLTGWRLRPLVNLVRQGKLSSVRSLDIRYSQVNQKSPFIARIKITPVKEG
jgi:hypothetical protein